MIKFLILKQLMN